MSEAERGEHSKMIGLIAQKEFDSWCTPARLTTNRSLEDDEGWDFLVQAKTAPEPGSFLDQRPPAFSAFVQVKGTADPEGAFRISLSNALKLVLDQPGPAFIFVARVQDDLVSVAWLVHCDRSFIESALRDASIDSATPPNKRFLRFRAIDHPEVTRSTLRNALETQIGPPRAYFDWKREIIDTVGYEGGALEMRIQPWAKSEDDALDELADFSVGLRPLKARSAEIFDIRFGNSRLKKTIGELSLTRKLVASGPEVTIEVEGANGERHHVPCVGYQASAYVPFLPSDLDRLRLVSPFLELLVTPAKGTEGMRRHEWTIPDLATSISSSNLESKARSAAILRLIREQGTRVVLRSSEGKELAIPIGRRDGVADNPANQRYLKAIEAFQTVVQSYRLAIHRGTFGRDAIEGNVDILGLLALIATGEECAVEVRFPVREPPKDVGLGDRVSFVFCVPFKFPESKLVAVTSVTGIVEVYNDDLFRVQASKIPRLNYRNYKTVTVAEVEEQLAAGARALEHIGGQKVFVRPPELPRAWLRPGRPKR